MTTLRSWTAAQLHSLSRSVASVLWPAELPCFDDGDQEQQKLLFTPDVASSSDYSFYTWQPGGERKTLPCAAGALPGGAHVSQVTQPLHGLVLLRCSPPDAALAEPCYYVCNPSTGAVLALPDTRSRREGEGLPDTCAVRYGLGYSEATGEYKVVRLFSLCDHRGVVVSMSCEVLVLGASRQWRRAVGGRPPLRSFDWLGKEAAAYLNGALHFLCDAADAAASAVVTTFNVSDETFGEVSLPPGLLVSSDDAKLAVLDGRLCDIPMHNACTTTCLSL